jgi:DNA invertase Pin-like site-specific DNA recombinase
MHQPTRALGYVRVSTDEQAGSGLGLAAQRAAIEAEAARKGWDLMEIVGEDAGASSATLDREGLQSALSRLDRHEADVLVVAKLDRLSRSVAQGGAVLERATERGWSLAALDFGLDTTTPAGEMVANVMLSMARYERRLIGQRTRDALAAKKAAGVRLGRPRQLPAEVVERIVRSKAAGGSLAGIARELSDEDVATAQGGVRWYASTVAAVLRSAELDGQHRGQSE